MGEIRAEMGMKTGVGGEGMMCTGVVGRCEDGAETEYVSEGATDWLLSISPPLPPLPSRGNGARAPTSARFPPAPARRPRRGQ